MNLEERKKKIIKYITELNDIDKLIVMEEILTYEKLSNHKEIKDLNYDQKQKDEIKQYFTNRAKIANEEYLQGKITSQEDLIIESKSW